MLRIRLSRTGKKKQPSYRVVIADSEARRDGRVLERIGHYNPRIEPLEYSIDEDRALYWLSKGAQPSDAVRRLLVKQGTYDRLARLHQGEAHEVLVAEYLGVEHAVEESGEQAAAAAIEEAAESETEIMAEADTDVVSAVEGLLATDEEE
jgi:small subunit ribosomal protein S16